MFVFFFQAEDGIRDVAVTGVQTCALPISSFWLRTGGGPSPPPSPSGRGGRSATFARPPCRMPPARAIRSRALRRGGRSAVFRSEERRVGKECRSRWSRETLI